MPKHHTSLLEIVELANGEIALRRPDDQTEPLVCIRFSAESLEFLGDARHIVAKAMIEAGLEAVHDLREQMLEQEDEASEATNEDIEAFGRGVRSQVLH